MVQKNNQPVASIPSRLLLPIKTFLESEIIKWKRTEKDIKKSDPFSDTNRLMQNSVEQDVDEQVGHFESEVKVSFVKKQLVQLRKALTMIKVGKYGICEKCGKMIDTDRLAVKPEVTICINCAVDRE
ncbi:TraR/DksA C4-type zinc finger protein [Candidatus Shapirobacteria bacterium]|nr:TraR/DksA C4-type zinc finger protein [Candidatus Shapirobacteria bacterium]